MLKTPETMNQTDITMEDLLSRTSNLTVLDEDGWEINNEGGTEVNSLCAMGRWVSNRPMSRSLLRTILGRVWGISEKEWNVEIKFTSKEASFLVFTFKSSQDLNRIVIKNPWFLTNGTLILERLDGIPQIWENSLTKFPLSGRIFNLPPRSITKGNLERLAGFVGDVIEVQKLDIPKIVSKGYFTFKVWFDISKPICPGFLFPSAEPMAYIEDGLGNQQPAYGSWLKIDDRKEEINNSTQKNSGVSRPMIPPPGFTEKIHSPYATTPTDGGKISGHSFAPINGLGKEILVTSPGFSCNSEIGMLNKGKQKISNGNLGLDFDMEKPIAEGECSGKGINLIMVQEGHGRSKRNGSLREEGTINLLNDPKITSNLAPSYGQRNPTETISTISMNLTEVPINYDCNLEILKKTEGPSKRRKVIPKRTKNIGNGGNKRKHTEQIQQAGQSGDSKEISMVTDLTFEMIPKAANSLGFEGCFVVDAKGKSGGLALLWSNEYSIHIKSFTEAHIDALVENNLGFLWRFTGFYGSPDPGGRVDSWKLLKRLQPMFNGAWVCGGDFNEIVNQKEKKGGGPKPEYLMRNFRRAISDCQLRKIHSVDDGFTWCNGRVANLIFEKLDRILCNSFWKDKFKKNKVSLLNWWNSDHRPLLLQSQSVDSGNSFNRHWGTRFHFEQAWADNEDCRRIIEEVWQKKHQGDPVLQLSKLLTSCGSNLHTWNMKQKKEMHDRTKELKGKIESLANSTEKEDWMTTQRLEHDLNCVEEKKEMYWKQRSRALGETWGQNTKFFHYKASQRRKKNTIMGLYDDRQQWKTAEKDLERIAIDYFQKLFTKSNRGVNLHNILHQCVPFSHRQC
uniref:Endonuclease/exonuclease/phosphatase domain-containing protein n=1 Tax=Cannabis sativa TaxID=3483 RepID=A0A803NUL6_CANSA